MNTLLWVDFDFFFSSFFLVLIYNRKKGKKEKKLVKERGGGEGGVSCNKYIPSGIICAFFNHCLRPPPPLLTKKKPLTLSGEGVEKGGGKLLHFSNLI